MRCDVPKELIDNVHSVTLRIQGKQPQSVLLVVVLDAILLLLLLHHPAQPLVSTQRSPRHQDLSLGSRDEVQAQVGQSFGREDGIDDLNVVSVEILQQKLLALRVIVLSPETQQDLGNAVVLLLHLLVVAAALLSLPRSHESSHRLEYFVHPPHVFVQEVIVVNLQKPVISLVLLQGPMSEFLVRVACLLSLRFSRARSVGR